MASVWLWIAERWVRHGLIWGLAAALLMDSSELLDNMTDENPTTHEVRRCETNLAARFDERDVWTLRIRDRKLPNRGRVELAHRAQTCRGRAALLLCIRSATARRERFCVCEYESHTRGRLLERALPSQNKGATVGSSINC